MKMLVDSAATAGSLSLAVGCRALDSRRDGSGRLKCTTVATTMPTRSCSSLASTVPHSLNNAVRSVYYKKAQLSLGEKRYSLYSSCCSTDL